MSPTPVLRASGLLFLAWAFATACTVSAGNGARASQCRIDTAVLCPGDFVGYSCQGESKPSLTCGAGTLEEDGEIGYCCGVRDTGPCVVDTTTSCSDGSTGYSCAPGVQPNATDARLGCSAGVAGPNADELYCCIGIGSSCAADPNIAGCEGGSKGFACTGADTPDQTQTLLVCSDATPGLDSELLYCCSPR